MTLGTLKPDDVECSPCVSNLLSIDGYNHNKQKGISSPGLADNVAFMFECASIESWPDPSPHYHGRLQDHILLLPIQMHLVRGVRERLQYGLPDGGNYAGFFFWYFLAAWQQSSCISCHFGLSNNLALSSLTKMSQRGSESQHG